MEYISTIKRCRMEQNKKWGLIGFPLKHSYSKKHFTEKFQKEGLSSSHAYELYPLEELNELPELLKREPNLQGLNVTIPYKEKVMKYLDDIDTAAAEIGAVNTINIDQQTGRLKGYNTDVYGFEMALKELLDEAGIQAPKALILGTGGASKAAEYVLNKKSIHYLKVSRTDKGDITYDNIDKEVMGSFQLIINTTPLGTFPNVEGKASLPYKYLTEHHCLFDMVYNPPISAFLQEGKNKKAFIKNGLKMLYLQAEKAWEIWNQY